MVMAWEIVLDTIKIRDYTPVTVNSKNKVDRTQKLYEILKMKIGDDLPRIKKLSIGKPLAIDVCYYLSPSVEDGLSKKDLDNLLKILFDALSATTNEGQKPVTPRLGLMSDDTFVYKINCEKKENSGGPDGFDLKISREI